MPYFVFKGVRASSPAFTNALEHTPKSSFFTIFPNSYLVHG
jgi:hypothetical protein